MSIQEHSMAGAQPLTPDEVKLILKSFHGCDQKRNRAMFLFGVESDHSRAGLAHLEGGASGQRHGTPPGGAMRLGKHLLP